MRKFLILFLIFCFVKSFNFVNSDKCVNLTGINLNNFSKYVIPSMDGKAKGDNGRIVVIGKIYFSAMASLKSGADVVTIMSSERNLPILKTLSMDYIVFPYLETKYLEKLKHWIDISQLVVFSTTTSEPGRALCEKILNICRELNKPIILDLVALRLVSQNLSLITNYTAGIILTPDAWEAKDMFNITGYNDWSFLDENVSVLLKGKADKFYNNNTLLWSSDVGGSPKRTLGQGDMLAGILGTFYNWALKANICPLQAQSIAAYAASRLTRAANAKAFEKFGRSMVATDMLNSIHEAFEELFVL